MTFRSAKLAGALAMSISAITSVAQAEGNHAPAAPAARATATEGWKREKPVPMESNAFKYLSFGPNPVGDYVSVEFLFAPFEAARLQLEPRVGLQLKNRGEAHVTVISPPEFKVLSKVLAPKEIRSAVQSEIDLGKVDARPLCVGEGTSGSDQTWFVVIEMPSAGRARRAVESLFLKKGGEKPAFKADEFYPHVTLGFTKRDLHLQDGVVKNVTSCKYPIRR